MSDMSAVEVIAGVLDQHSCSGAEPGLVVCYCDGNDRFESFRAWAEHVASEVDKALGGLRQEKSWRVGQVAGLVLDDTKSPDAEVIARRWVGDWTREPRNS